jgi:hypothetical protein
MFSLYEIRGNILEGPAFTCGPYLQYQPALDALYYLNIYLAVVHADHADKSYTANLSEYVLNVDELTHINTCVELQGNIGED